MRTRIFLAHLGTALAVFLLWRLLPGLNIFIAAAVVLVTTWIMWGLSWDPISQSISEIATWIKNENGREPPPLPSEFQGVIDATRAADERRDVALAELVADQHQSSLILSSMRDGVVLTTTDGIVTLANPAAAAIFRRPVDEFVGRPLIYSVHSRELDKLIAQVIDDGREAEAQIEVFLPRERRLRVLALPVYDGRRLTAVLTVFQDITGRHRVDAVRRAFVANVSHELKTPVAGINLLADSLLTSMEVNDNEAKRFAGKLAGEARLLSQLISDLLDLSQLEAPELRPIFAPVSLSSIARRAVVGFTETAAAKGLSLRTELARGLPKINANEDQLKLMLRNLIENAIHYTQTGGDVLVKTEAADGFVKLEVIDTGIGVPASDRRRVFERFYRVDKARSRETGGTGLGLSIVKHVVDNHEGKISLVSTVGVGSKFSVLLPMKIRSGA